VTAAAPIESPPIVETASPSPSRGQLLLHDEIADIHANLANLTPAAIACVHTVLESVLHESELPPATAAAARQLLQEIAAVRQAGKRDGTPPKPTHRRQTSPAQTRRQAIARATVRPRPLGPIADS
jgi:hypothetical protein